ncbi:MAG: single-stranded DNA-binding protein [Actinomycetota bacterium]|nr:single-stranded DNA-binding protein [Actinomycetota bacterium]
MRSAHETVRIARDLSRTLQGLHFGPPVAYVYDPLDYARSSLERYLERYAGRGIEVLLVGMNPGPFGMAQTGVPFGDVAMVRDWLEIEEPVERPAREHPKRPIDGFACRRSEVSGTRLWGWARGRFGTPERFFARFFVWNWCPLVFLEESGRNRTPDNLPAAERRALSGACDDALERLVRWMEPRFVVGVGTFAANRARMALGESGPRIGSILHPSPASPRANRGWAAQAEAQLRELGIEL